MRNILSRKNKRAAIDLSMTTIIVVVLSVTLLILGFVLIRSIMCQAIGFTDQVGGKVDGEIERLFSSTADEYSCIGESGSPVVMVPGETNVIYCGVKAPDEARYKFDISINKDASSIDKDRLKDWFRDGSFNQLIVPGDEKGKKIGYMDIPDNAPEGIINFRVEVYKDEVLLGSSTLDYKVSRQGAIRGFIC